MTYNTTALILSRRPFREADLKVAYFSREFGKMEAVAIGARKIQSKLAGQLEPLAEVKIMIASGREFDKIGQAMRLENFGLPQVKNIRVFWQAQKAVGLVEKLSAAGQRDKRLYQLLRDFLKFNFQEDGAALFYFFTFKLFDLLGFGPELQKCLRCRRPLKPGKNVFDFLQGGVVCSLCRGQEKTRKEISNEALKIWRFARGHSLAEAGRLKISLSLAKELDDLIEKFLQYHF